MKKIYFGCSLKHAPQDYIDDIYHLRDELKKYFSIIEFLGLGNGTDEEVFTHDTQSIKNCGLMIAEVSLPSTGLGYEIGYAESSGKEVVAIAKTGSKVSAMIKGNPRIRNVEYTNISDLIELLRKEYV